ncbi:MAG: hypothetical protein EBZ69_02125 [Alphaproteobacteria bacterium]|nr:hypothetical protein [Alphaproteobacteria bacterium]NDG19366.1 hypothetical protein [Betaproteobacteria bacterium]
MSTRPPARPSEVRVGPYLFRVEYREDVSDSEPDLFGITIPRDQRIIVSSRQTDQCERDTLLHEVLHAVFYASGLFREVDNEERVVAGVSTWLLMVLRDNPQLAKFLVG